jgi:hypothetical protein
MVFLRRPFGDFARICFAVQIEVCLHIPAISWLLVRSLSALQRAIAVESSRSSQTPQTRKTTGTIMAYGQTGAGKTFTMTGDCTNFKQRGVTPRAIGQLFEDILERSQYEFKVSVSYMEIYNEKVFDLLDTTGGQTSSSDFSVVEDPATRSMHVRGLTQMPVSEWMQLANFPLSLDDENVLPYGFAK